MTLRERLRACSIWLALTLGVCLGSGAAGAADQVTVPPTVCKIGISVEELFDLNLATDTFGAVLWLWSLCPSDEFQPLRTISMPSATPGIEMGSLETEDTGGKGFYQYRRIQGTFRHDWNLRRYPFDSQRLVIPFDESEIGAARLLFDADTTSSFINPDLAGRLDEWRFAPLSVSAGVVREASSYGVPGGDTTLSAHFEAVVTLQRERNLQFVKLISGVMAAALIAFLSFFIDPRNTDSLGSRLGLLVGALFATLINLRYTDDKLGDTSKLTLVTEIHLVTMVLIVVLALLGVRERRRAEKLEPVSYPNWTMLAATMAVYFGIVTALVGLALQQ